VHCAVEGHDTPDNALAWAPLGFGVLWITQPPRPPLSASVTWTPALVSEYPTPVHCDVDGHDTPNSALACAPFGFGVLCTDQLLPLQRSARVTVVPALFTELPTPVHTVLEAQATLTSWLDLAPLGLGVLCTDQALPFQRSASVFRLPVLLA